MIADILTAREYIGQFDVPSQLSSPPGTHEAPARFYEPGLKAIFYDSVPYRGKPTRCFAWIGLPEGASRDNPVPGIVLIHGGGGTALANWVRHWNGLGYAAISMDCCGAMPCWSATPGWHPSWPRHEYGGAPGWGGFDKVDLPVKEQWPYQAVASVLRATALLKGMPEVDAARIGIAGISWGGFLALIASSVSPQNTYRFVIPVYASTHFTDHFSSTVDPARCTEEQLKRWTQMWDPTPALRKSATPTLFLTDAEDLAFALPSWEKTTELQEPGYVKRSLRIGYSHDHEASMHSRTEAAFADAVLNHDKLPEWDLVRNDGTKLRTAVEMNGRRIVSCKLCYTRAEGFWADRRWREIPLKTSDGQVEVDLPRYATAAFFAVSDDLGGIWTSQVVFWRQ